MSRSSCDHPTPNRGYYLGHWRMGVLLKIPIFPLLLFFTTESFEEDEHQNHRSPKTWFPGRNVKQERLSGKVLQNAKGTDWKQQKNGEKGKSKKETNKGQILKRKFKFNEKASKSEPM